MMAETLAPAPGPSCQNRFGIKWLRAEVSCPS